MIKAPCQNCPDRWLDVENMKRCHDCCERYNLFKAELTQMHKCQQENANYAAYIANTFNEWQKRKDRIRADRKRIMQKGRIDEYKLR